MPPRAGAGVEIVASAGELLAQPLDVLAPCAVGGLVDEAVAAQLDCRVVCGAANNPLADERAATMLTRRDVLYVPDFLANCGGLIHVDWERRGVREPATLAQALADARERMHAVLVEARADGRLPGAVAEEHARRRVHAVRGARRLSSSS